MTLLTTKRTRAAGTAGPMTHQEEPLMSAKTVLILPNRRNTKTHALDCKWAAGIGGYVSSGRNGGYVQVPAASIPPGVGRCSHCGGGR